MRRHLPLFVAVLAAASACTGQIESATNPDDDVAVDEPTEVGPDAGDTTDEAAIQHVFVIVMENKNWSSIAGNSAAPYINDTLLPMGAHAEAYNNLPGLHPSEPNYIWLESGSTGGMTTDGDPSPDNSSTTTAHLVTLLEAAGISWKSYQEDMPLGVCPLDSSGFYAAKHNPFLFFQDVSDGNSFSSQRCIDHVRPMTELQADLDADTVPRYAFLTPNLCNDMHGATGCPATNLITQGDNWLAQKIPAIMSSPVYQAGHAAILITWDESSSGDEPIGMIVISPHAKAGYAGTVPYTHSSTLRTLEEIFGVGPLLGDAANATSLVDLFTDYP